MLPFEDEDSTTPHLTSYMGKRQESVST